MSYLEDFLIKQQTTAERTTPIKKAMMISKYPTFKTDESALLKWNNMKKVISKMLSIIYSPIN